MTLDEAAEMFHGAVSAAVRKHSLWYLIQGILLVLGGILAIVYPLISSISVVILLGWLLISRGIVQGISLLGARQVPYFWLQLISAILGMLIGFLFLHDPTQGLVTITLLLVVLLMVEGISKNVFALTIRPFPNWGWVLASGLIGIALSLILLVSLPVTATWLIGLMLGVELISIGGRAGLARLAGAAGSLTAPLLHAGMATGQPPLLSDNTAEVQCAG